MKYFTAIVIALLAGCYGTGPTEDGAFDVTATVYDGGNVVSDFTARAFPGAPFTVSRHSDAPEPVTVGLVLVVNPGESPDTVRITGSIRVNDQFAEPEMTLILGTAADGPLPECSGPRAGRPWWEREAISNAPAPSSPQFTIS